MKIVLSLAPVLTAIILIVVFKRSAFQSGMLSLALAALIAFFAPDFALSPATIVGAIIQGSVNTIGLAYVLLGGVFLYQVLSAGRALDKISNWIGHLVPHPAHQIFVIVYGVSVFFESATGFGVGIIVTAPLLIALGYDPIRAAVLALIGQCAVTWGALAVGTVLGGELSGVDTGRIGTLAAVFSFPYVVASGLVAIYISQQHRPLRFSFSWLLVYALTLSLVLAGVSHSLGVELAGCFAGLAVVGVGVIAGRLRSNKQPRTTQAMQAGIGTAIFPLAVLVLSLLISRLNPNIQAALQSTGVIQWPGWNFKLALAYHPGSLLVMSALVGLLLLPDARMKAAHLIRASTIQWCKAAVAVLGFLALGQLMLEAGMTDTIAESLISYAGSYYAAVVPVIGGIGGFITASNAASNALFMNLQMAAADQLGLQRDLVATAQNAAGSNMTLASPGRLVFAAAIAGIAGGESMLMRRVLPLALVGLLSTMVISFFLIRSH